MVKKDAQHIETILRNTYKGLWVFNNLKGCINAALSALWANEEIIDVFFYKIDEFRYVLFVTDKGRIVQAVEDPTSSYGPYVSRALEMIGADANKSRCIETSTGGWFGKTYYCIVFEGQKTPFEIHCEDKNTASAILTSVLQAAKKAAAASAPKPAASAAPAASSMASAIAEIRKMYEDGLISKEEMLDLIKALK